MIEAGGRDATDVAASSAAPAAGAPSATRCARAFARQSRVGLTLAGLVMTIWLALLGAGLFVVDLSAPVGPWVAIGVAAWVAVQTWASVGLFIVAHDAMHGSLAPGRPWLQRSIGRACLTLYAGLSFDRMKVSHHAHHRSPGTADDPDFDPAHPGAFLPWLATFMRRHIDARALVFQTAVAFTLLVVLSVPPANVLIFWAAPSLLAALQLFYFGTYRPHRHGRDAFADAHATRSDAFPDWLSILTCFHFGRHHEHHLAPHLPWWRLKRGAAR